MNQQTSAESGSEKPKWSHPGNQPDVYVRCPYFPEHELRRSRLLYHLPKCQSHPNAPKLLVCPFNFLHRVRPEDRVKHLEECEDKIKNNFQSKELPSFKSTEAALKDNKMPIHRTAQIIRTHMPPDEAYTGDLYYQQAKW